MLLPISQKWGTPGLQMLSNLPKDTPLTCGKDCNPHVRIQSLCSSILSVPAVPLGRWGFLTLLPYKYTNKSYSSIWVHNLAPKESKPNAGGHFRRTCNVQSKMLPVRSRRASRPLDLTALYIALSSWNYLPCSSSLGSSLVSTWVLISFYLLPLFNQEGILT